MRPEQAVILCGGLGTRLRPLTENLPKPLAPVNGRPFLLYLLEQLREQGFCRVLLLTGYLGEQIRECVGDGSAFGLQVEYSEGPASWETGRRIWEAREQIDDTFLLLYSDNYAAIDIGQVVRRSEESRNAAITLLLHPKDSGNIRVAQDGRVEQYDATRTAEGLTHVEIGYMVVDRSASLEALTDVDASFSTVIRTLVDQGRVVAVKTRSPYHSISDLTRLRQAEAFLHLDRLLLIDRDGTINRKAPRGEYVSDWTSFDWIEDTVDAMKRLARSGFRFVVISNQAGIGRGVITQSQVDEVNERMLDRLKEEGIPVVAMYVCPHHWEDECECRKPEPGMFFQASREHSIRLDRTIYIGDDPRDALAAHNANCLSVLVGDDRNVEPGQGVTPDFKAETASDAISWIESVFQSWEENEESVHC